jgi:uncharacterized protein YlzI (FlbEa/FlbD family)
MTVAAGRSRPPPQRPDRGAIAMIVLHRLTHPDQPFHLNPDQILTIEATPDTVVSLESAAKFVVIETPEEIVERIREWRASIVVRANAQPVLRAVE